MSIMLDKRKTEKERAKLLGCYIAYVNLTNEHLYQGSSCKKNQRGVCFGTCGAGGSIAVVLQLN